MQSPGFRGGATDGALRMLGKPGVWYWGPSRGSVGKLEAGGAAGRGVGEDLGCSAGVPGT